MTTNQYNFLTDFEVDFFRRTGYLKVSAGLDEDVVLKACSLLDDYVENRIGPFGEDEKGEIVKVFDLYGRNPLFELIFKSQKILNPLRSLLGDSIEFLPNRHNHAAVISGKVNERNFHRDVLSWSRPIITVLVYTQDTSLENGCTEIIPSSQYLPFKPINYSHLPRHAGSWLHETARIESLEEQALPVVMKRGQILIFDSLLYHSAGINMTSTRRYALAGGYHSTDELLPDNSHGDRILVSGKRVYCGNRHNWKY